MIFVSNICITTIVVYCLLHISAYMVANFITVANDGAVTIGKREKHKCGKEVTHTEVIMVAVLFLILFGAVMPRFCIWLF